MRVVRAGSVGAVVLAAGMILISCGGGDTPISEQNCGQLAETFAEIQDRLSPNEDYGTQAEATEDAAVLNDRVDELGGCSNEPSLQ